MQCLPSCPRIGGGQLRVGLPVQVRLVGRYADAGEVRDVAASADPVTRTFLVKVAVQAGCAAAGATVYVTPQWHAAEGQRPSSCPRAACARRAVRRRCGCSSRATAAAAQSALQVVQVARADGNEVLVRRRPGARHAGGGLGVHVLARLGKRSSFIYQNSAKRPQIKRRQLSIMRKLRHLPRCATVSRPWR